MDISQSFIYTYISDIITVQKLNSIISYQNINLNFKNYIPCDLNIQNTSFLYSYNK